MIWKDENRYDRFISAIASSYGVEMSLIKAIIAKESSFNPLAFKSEPQIKDESTGLMQLLFRTAKALGYTGTPEGLKDPQVNINLGSKLISQNLKQSKGKLDIAISAYNAGFSKDRPWDGKRSTQGKLVNQDYVDDVLIYKSYFEKKITEKEVSDYKKTKWIKPALSMLIPFIMIIGGFFFWKK